MKTKQLLFTTFLMLFLSFNMQLLNAQSNDSVKTPISQSHIDRANAIVEIMANELGLTPEQKELVSSAIARRNFDNSIKTRGLVTQEEKNVVYRATYLEFVATLKTKMSNALVNKVGTWESEYKERLKKQVK